MPARARGRTRVACVAVSAGALTLAGCGGKQSIVAPHSHQTHAISLLWWWMLGAAVVVFFGAVGLLVLSWVRRRSAGLPMVGEREDLAGRMVITFGILVPVVALIALFAVADLYVIRSSEAPNVSSTSMTVDVVGHQWWWEARYPGTAAVTANEIHIPAAERINVVATTADVIHSFWVPQLARKIDMIPGRENRILLEASRPGVYAGQCSEFCGLQHAHMRLRVIAEPSGSFQRWLQNAAAPALAATSPAAREGEQLFTARGCGACHELRGSEASGTVGPDLTHLATRATLAAVTIPDNAAELAAWIHDPQAIKPGDRMPDLGLSQPEVQKLVSYLEGLR